MILTIKITTEVLKRSMWCNNNIEPVHKNCAIALAIRDIMPNASVTNKIYPGIKGLYDFIELPLVALDFIREFDLNSPELRLEMQPFSFQITIPDSVIEAIEIGGVERSETLELINT